MRASLILLAVLLPSVGRADPSPLKAAAFAVAQPAPPVADPKAPQQQRIVTPIPVASSADQGGQAVHQPSALAPPPARPKPKGAVSRIAGDTVEAVADLLPWVDRARKDEPIEDVLARVADELSRASVADPEWVNPAEAELRALAKRLATLPAPPAITPVQQTEPGDGHGRVMEARSFRPRVAWPGTARVGEVGRRPTGPETVSADEIGPITGPQEVLALANPDPAPPKPAKPAPAKRPRSR